MFLKHYESNHPLYNMIIMINFSSYFHQFSINEKRQKFKDGFQSVPVDKLTIYYLHYFILKKVKINQVQKVKNPV